MRMATRRWAALVGLAGLCLGCTVVLIITSGTSWVPLAAKVSPDGTNLTSPTQSTPSKSWQHLYASLPAGARGLALFLKEIYRLVRSGKQLKG